MSFELPQLPYSFDALEPWIDAKTVEIHYTKHHMTYLTNLNNALSSLPAFAGQSIEEILSHLEAVPETVRTAVRNNGGGYYNHIVYWNVMGANKGGEPLGKLAKAIETSFGGFTALKEQVEKAGLGRFGSGWAWLSKKTDGSLLVHSTPNQDPPLAEGLIPVIGVDVWEHAYYLKYQNRRAEYLTNWWNLVNWEEAERRYLEA
ncbi:MAG: superoxide dismutase [Chloroflexi bacterium]|nr:superoxide dismutase [Chloroflexota bacterium]